jgi:EGF-like domain
MALKRIPVSLLVFLCVSDKAVLRAQFCSSNRDCQHGGYCDNQGIMGNAEDPNHPHIFESSCVCPETYTGTYCTKPVLPVDDLGSNQNPSSYDDTSSNEVSLSTGTVVALSALSPVMLVLGFLCGAFFANKRARIKSPRTEADSPENAGDGEIIRQEKESVKLEDDANNACEIEVKSEVV